MSNKDQEFLDKILRKMFKIVGAKYTRKFTEQPEWYKKHTWDERQEDKFKRYFIKEIRR